MMIKLSPGDVVYCDGEVVSIVSVSEFSTTDTVTICRADSSVEDVPMSSILTEDQYLLGLAITILKGHDQLDADLTTSKEDSILEEMSPENFQSMIRLRNLRSDFANKLHAKNSRSN